MHPGLETPLSILQKIWKHDRFRPLQEEIINSVLNGQDTLALLPTGGGKSVCFQVPALMLDGVCVVVTPLIALMNDQVDQLKKKQLNAVAIHSAMRRQEIDLYLDNCIHGNVKFLYVSPERIQTELFRERVRQMKLSLIVVDEAHCISQWGYDFRPPYLQIATLREIHTMVPIVALTATATKDVQDDIVEKLLFRTPYEVHWSTFARNNLSFVVRKSENKEKKVLEILRKVPGSAIVYLRSRKNTQEIADWLTRNNVRSAFYHAGLVMDDRQKIQHDWINNKTRVIVATNAFGMGIDKPDVRLVIHLDLPENIESYYQEAGRAGRDGKRAYASIVYQEGDLVSLQTKVEQSQPSIEYLKKVYQALANYYQLALGSGEGESFDFDIHAFADQFHLHVQEVYSALRKLEEEGLVQFNESFYSPSQLHIAVDSIRLYEFQIANQKFDPVIKMLLRLYGGELYSGFLKVSESYLAQALKITVSDVEQTLAHLDRLKIVVYKPVRDAPQLTFVLPRQDADHLPVDRKRLEARKKLIFSKMQAMIDFTRQSENCRMEVVQEYFGEDSTEACGKCDVCVARRKKENSKEFDEIRNEVLLLLSKREMSVEELEEQIAPPEKDIFIEVIRDLLEDGVISYDSVWRLKVVVTP